MNTATEIKREDFIPEYSEEFMFSRVRDAIVSQFEDIDISHAAMLLFEFEETHGSNSILSLYGFLRYCARKSGEIEEEKRQHMIKSVLAHDLNGRNDKLMSPKSSSYWKFANE